MEIFQILRIILLLFFFGLGIWYLFPSIFTSKLKPYKWGNAVNNNISKSLIKLERKFDDKVRFYNFWFQIERLKRENIKGSFAELGVYKGETARLIHEMDKTRKLYLFDTFEGFADKDLQRENSSDRKYSTSNFSDVNIKSVESFFNGNLNVKFIKGYFPETINQIEEQKYAFVHLDADLYLPTLSALNYFYSRLSEGGVIIIHDYNHSWDGVGKAVSEFATNICENVIEIADWQGSAMIIRNKKLSFN
ncbi:MAG: TylF/MycF/NovP-related O-methyltransferase [Bacteroidota bacterium]